MEFDPQQLLGYLQHVPPWVGVGAVTAAAAFALALYISINRRSRRGAHHSRRINWKQEIGFAIVQSVLSYAVITGVYEFFAHRLGMPRVESATLALFIEAAVWTSVGFIVEHGRSTVERRQADGTVEQVPATGWGLAGPFFWIFSSAGGVLAILGAAGPLIAVGRIVVVVIGTALWVLRLMRATRRSGRRSRFRWTPRRIAIELGWLEPEPEEGQDENREWRIAQLAKAIRQSNRRWGPGWRTLGAIRAGRTLERLGDCTPAEVVRAAQVRAAAGQVLLAQARFASPVMESIMVTLSSATAQIADLGQQADLQRARQQLLQVGSAGPSPQQREHRDPSRDSGPPVDAGGGRDERPDETVSSMSDQLARDRAAAEQIARAVRTLTEGATYTTWEEIRAAIKTGNLLNSVSTTAGFGKPRIGRVLPRGHELCPDLASVWAAMDAEAEAEERSA